MSKPNRIGQCIYCGTTTPPLTREHIIPLGLNGDHVLHDASCEDCANKTKKIEDYVLREMFGAYRTATQMRTRRPKLRPKAHPVGVKPTRRERYVVDVETRYHPTVVALPVLPRARFLRGLPDTDVPIDAQWWRYVDQAKLDALPARLGLSHGQFDVGECNPSRLSQMLAKIAHGAAVEKYGVYGFEPFVVDLALGRSQSINYLVGCNENPPPPPDEALHTVGFAMHNQTGIVRVDLRLFANLGAPRYHVVVGKLKESFYRSLVK